jgi:hypothetical protein
MDLYPRLSVTTSPKLEEHNDDKDIVKIEEDIEDFRKHEASTDSNVKKEKVEDDSEQNVERRSNSRSQKPPTTPRRVLSWSSCSSLSDPPSELECPTALPRKAKAPVDENVRIKKEKEDDEMTFVSSRFVGNRRKRGR